MCMKDHHNDNSNPCCFSCCHEKEYVTDKLCCDFDVQGNTEASATTLFTSDLATACDLVATGSIKNCGPAGITVQFVEGVQVSGTGGTVVRSLVIPPNGCATFTMRRFNLIRAFTNSGTVLPSNPGEICIVQRFRLH